MVIKLSPQLRRRETQLELERLDKDLQSWLQRQRQQDAKEQHKTQLDRLESRLRGAIRKLNELLDQLDTEGPIGEIYEQCRQFDRRIFWIRWVWSFFREKFDQREDPQLEKALKAADEVVWSCYSTVIKRVPAAAKGRVAGVAAPLPFIEARYSPAAYSSGTLPSDLVKEKSEVDFEFQRQALDAIPVALLRLPPSCIGSPWWLIFVGHEIGHHIQADLKLHEPFKKKVEEVVVKNGGDEPQKARWGRWSAEIFADVFSVVAMGQWAVGAMAELELTRSEEMFKTRTTYPPPLVRLHLLARTADEVLKLTNADNSQPGTRNLPELPSVPQDDSAETRQLKSDLRMVSPVVAAALDELPDPDLPVTIRDLCDFLKSDFAVNSPKKPLVNHWAQSLRGSANVPIPKEARSARLLAAASRVAWLELAEEDLDDGKRDEQRLILAERAISTILASAEEGTRKRVSTDVGEADSAESPELAELLMAVSPDLLEGP